MHVHERIADVMKDESSQAVEEAGGVAGRAPEEWEARLEQAAKGLMDLDGVLCELKQEIGSEHSWIEDNPAPSTLVRMFLEFIGETDGDRNRFEERIEREIAHERSLVRRYRTWKPGESWQDRLNMYLKEFPAQVRADGEGLQFPGFVKYKGIHRSDGAGQAFACYLNERFPGRDPANFYVTFDATSGELILKRIYKKELPRLDGKRSAARAVLRELIRDVADPVSGIRQIEVDNVANRRTRQELMIVEKTDGRTLFSARPGADVEGTPLGYLMRTLAMELGLVPGPFRVSVQQFGIIRIELDVT
jgi:hypothetical protein